MALGLIQKALADKANMPQGHISRLEKGEYLSMNLDKLAQLADVLHTTVDYLLARSDDPGAVPDLVEDAPVPQPTKRQRTRKAAPVAACTETAMAPRNAHP
jgi:transcriptional regulator with XRE-family HTH domain